MEHHKGSDGEREFVERRINELDRRRDANLKEKLDAIERFFNLSMNTKSEALNIAISRIQGDSRDCAARCANQVKVFYEMIHALRDKDTVKTMTIDSLKLEVVNLKTELNDLYDTLENLQLEANKHKLENVTTITDLTTKVDNQAKDLKRVPLKMIAIASVIGVAIVEVAIRILGAIIKALSKNGGLGI